MHNFKGTATVYVKKNYNMLFISKIKRSLNFYFVNKRKILKNELKTNIKNKAEQMF